MQRSTASRLGPTMDKQPCNGAGARYCTSYVVNKVVMKKQSLRPKAAPWLAVERKRPRCYKGLPMKTDTNLHEQLAGLVTQIVAPGGEQHSKPQVIDLGCGAGAMAQRLVDLGYLVVAADCDRKSFAADGPTFVELDLEDQAAMDRFIERYAHTARLILAVEVIEHLRDPWRFVANCRRLCGPESHLIVTLPNVGSWWSRLWYLLKGEPWGFGQESWDDPGHINPITATEMEGILRCCGFRCLDILAGGCLPILWAYNWKRLLASLAVLPLRPLMGGHKDGWVLCFHAVPAEQ